jgi:hypothetical protein
MARASPGSLAECLLPKSETPTMWLPSWDAVGIDAVIRCRASRNASPNEMPVLDLAGYGQDFSIDTA